MHEMALCTEVAETVLAEAERANAVSVNEVCMVIGEMRDIVEDLFDGLFHYIVRGTVAENAQVIFTRMPLMAQCNQCGTPFKINLASKEAVRCPHCQSKEYEVKSGMEFFISSIDVTTESEAETLAQNCA